ncbi:MAG: ABC transporter permease [Geodermatophilaceae bacterium]|nr:ABC transporter permease [Geodermatophilaceae bacterium]MDQ3463281.1 ABC transporter permease [Actinomycetota bacterium]
MSTTEQRDLKAPAGPSDKPQVVEREFTIKARSQRQQIARRFLHSKQAMGGLIVLALLVLAGWVGPLFYRFGFNEFDPLNRSVGPGVGGHPLGTEGLGRDLLAQLMRGVQRSTLTILIAVSISLFLGVAVGLLAGYYGGWVDNLLMRLVDLILTLPALVVLIVVASNFPQARTAVGIAVIIGVFGWLDLSRILRSQILGLREREFVEAAHALGASDRRIMFKHLIPNTLGSIIVWATLAGATTILLEASLTYLGFGVQNDISLGKLVSDGVSAAQTRPWLFYYPGIMLLIIALCINLIGDGIRDAFDPSNKKVRA